MRWASDQEQRLDGNEQRTFRTFRTTSLVDPQETFPRSDLAGLRGAAQLTSRGHPLFASQIKLSNGFTVASHNIMCASLEHGPLSRLQLRNGCC